MIGRMEWVMRMPPLGLRRDFLQEFQEILIGARIEIGNRNSSRSVRDKDCYYPFTAHDVLRDVIGDVHYLPLVLGADLH